MSSSMEKVINIFNNNLFTNTGVSTCLTKVIDLSNNLDTRVNAVINGAPETLNTLNELAAALGDDANYATTTTSLLATKYSAGSDVSFNDLSANDISGVDFFTMGGKFIGDLSGNATTTTTATTATSATTATTATSATTATNSTSMLTTTATSTSFARIGISNEMIGFNGTYSYFGKNVAINSGDGTIVACASSFTSRCFVKVFKWDGSNWGQIGQTFQPSPTTEPVKLGESISLNKDGTILAFSTMKTQEYDSNSYGYVKIFSYSNNTWSQLGSDMVGPTQYDELGHDLKLSSDGTIIAICATTYFNVWKWNGSSWNKLGNNISISDSDKHSISLSADGTTVAIGNKKNDTRKGIVKVYRWNGSAWNQIGTSISGTETNSSTVGGFGEAVSLNSNGNILAFSYPRAKISGTYPGIIRIYEYSNNSWSQMGSDIVGKDIVGTQYNTNLHANIGYYIELSGDGKTLGFTSRIYMNDYGAYTIYKYTNDWNISKHISVDGPNSFLDGFGYHNRSFSMTEDASIIAVSIPKLNIGSNTAVGEVAVYQLDNTTYSDNFNISYNSSTKQIEFKTKDLTETEVSSKMNLDNSGNLTLTGKFNSLSTSGTTSLGGHILPTTNASYDLGSAEYKIRHLFLSDNSLWVGDDHKIDISGGNMRFKKRKNDKVPAAVTSAGGNETNALAHAGVSSLTDMTLDKWQNYAATLSGTPGIKEMFGNDQPDEFNTDKNLLDAIILPLKTDAGAPATSPTPETGKMIYNTNDNRLYIWNGSAWKSEAFSL
tara:strand:- start:1504 stop:3825 length:2322 start_codon:yes stop_codon:yes gene_type:complete